jgi:L-lactate dehydrogenase complex protein LldG
LLAQADACLGLYPKSSGRYTKGVEPMARTGTASNADPAGLFAEFKSRAEAVSAEVHRFATRTQALGFLLSFLREEGVAGTPGSSAVWAECPFLRHCDRAALSRELPGLRFDVTAETAAAARVGISQMEWAAAQTGTLVEDATRVEQRLVSSLPPVHIALIPTCGLVGDLAAAFGRVDPRRAAFLAAITGPSRTADIERVLTIGVHGPRRLIVVFVDELEGTPG